MGSRRPDQHHHRRSESGKKKEKKKNRPPLAYTTLRLSSARVWHFQQLKCKKGGNSVEKTTWPKIPAGGSKWKQEMRSSLCHTCGPWFWWIVRMPMFRLCRFPILIIKDLLGTHFDTSIFTSSPVCGADQLNKRQKPSWKTSNMPGFSLATSDCTVSTTDAA